MSGTLRSYFFMVGLARHHRVRLLVGAYDQSFWSPGDVDHARTQVEAMEVWQVRTPTAKGLRHVLNNVATWVAPATPPWWLDAAFAARIRQEITEFAPDVILSEGPAALHCHAFRDVPVVVDFCDAHALRVSRERHGPFGAWRRRTAIANREAFAASFAQWATVITERDASAVRFPHERVAVVSNGVDLDRYVPHPGDWDARTLAFVGAMDYAPNADAVEYLSQEIWPLVRRAEPEARLFIVGRSPGPAIQRLDGHEGVKVTGTVEDVRPFVWQSAASLAPLRYASGLQNKVIQSLAMAVPVVASPAANAGLGATEAEGVLVAETPEATADAALSLMRDRSRRTTLGERGRRFVIDRFPWDRAIERLEDVLARAWARHSHSQAP
jgi:hypothetical protein